MQSRQKKSDITCQLHKLLATDLYKTNEASQSLHDKHGECIGESAVCYGTPKLSPLF